MFGFLTSAFVIALGLLCGMPADAQKALQSGELGCALSKNFF